MQENRPLTYLQPGQRVWAKMIVPSRALRYTTNPSATMRKIQRIPPEAVFKLGYILEIRETGILVAYTTTLGKSPSLSALVTGIEDWYPVSPAAKHHILDPLSPVEAGDPASWIYIGQPILVPWSAEVRSFCTVHYAPAEYPIMQINPKPQILSEESLKLVRGVMKRDAKGDIHPWYIPSFFICWFGVCVLFLISKIFLVR
ncbi:hypothetical protein B0J17DRAFT_675686 [Rhizoctonia solani]|nr:hypothetical protein B0J17DRAFT_675686 [Rhizoctonia solani]